MINFDRKELKYPQKQNGIEVRLKSRAVSRGIAVGKIVCLYGHTRQFYKINLKDTKITREVRRFHAAVRLTKKHLKFFSAHNNELTNETKLNIFDFHQMILEDKSLLGKIEEKITNQKVNAEWAVKIVLDSYISNYKNISDENLRDRYIDLQDISDRLLNSLGGSSNFNLKLGKDSILVAKEIKPSTLIELTESRPLAIVAENGGWTSHTFILARELNIPAVTGAKNILRRVKNGDKVIVDGYNGQVILHPSKEALKKYKKEVENIQKIDTDDMLPFLNASKTLDNKEIIIWANIDLPSVYSKAKKLGAKGVGLYRSEFLFNQFKGFPSEEEQFEAYEKIGKLVGDDRVRIRTFDLSVNQLADESPMREKNPALGLRGIRLGFSHKKEFRNQIRALLRASAKYNIDIVLPMISDVSEVLKAKKIIQNEKKLLEKKQIEIGNPKLGVMIEVPSAVLTVEDISKEVDFMSLGTNDLVQYLLAVDRDNESVADYFKTLHPAVIRSIEKVINEAEKSGIPVVICGEMAGSPFYLPILIGLGARELSMNINSIYKIKKTISGIAFEEAAELAKKIKNCRTGEEIETLVREAFKENWSHLYNSNNFPI